MGEVYRARDTKLGRDVAIKVLPELFAADTERLARFQREAQLLAALNHPNIAAIYGLEDAGATRFIVMELVEGQSLAQRLTTPIARDEVMRIARQIIDAFEAAHDKGIVHRDLKPANVMLTEDGQVKVLDFGLAKLDASGSSGASGSDPAGHLTHSPTLTLAATQAGMILGTAAYMSPEQARGRPADKRSDVWAFGCVLYEMLAGKRVFDGDDVTDIIAAVVRAEPDWNTLPTDTPAGVRKILQGCLQKDRKARIPDMSVVRYLIADTEGTPAGHPTSPVKRPGRRVGAIAAVAAVAAAALASVATWASLRPVAPPKSPPMRFAIPQPDGRPFGMGAPDRAVVLSPDGAHIVSVHGADLGGGGELLVRGLEQLDAVPLRGITSARAPFISPDSRWIGFFDSGELKKVPMNGGPPIAICRIVGGTRESSWGPDDTIVFATNDPAIGLQSVSARGGEPKVLTKPDQTHGEVDHLFPSFLPDGRTVLFTIVMSGALENAQIAALDVTTGQRKSWFAVARMPNMRPAGICCMPPAARCVPCGSIPRGSTC
jgi:serine/threonine-protein kinase